MVKKYNSIYIELSNRCNLNCDFCSKNRREITTLTIEQLEHIFKEINNLTDYVYFHIKGEPLLYEYLDEALILASKFQKKVNITTNGRLLVEKLNILLKNNSLRLLNISLHSYNLSIEYNEILEILKIVKYLLENSQILLNLRLWNNNIVNNEIVLDVISNFFNKEIDKTKKVNVIIEKRLFFHIDDQFIWPQIDNNFVSDYGFCLGLDTHFGILSNGVVVPCCLDSEGIINLGNIFEKSLVKILESDRVKKIQKSFQNNIVVEELCKRCSYRLKFNRI